MTHGCVAITYGHENAPSGFAGQCQMKLVSTSKTTSLIKEYDTSYYTKQCKSASGQSLIET